MSCMTALEARVAMKKMCDKCPNSTYVPKPGEMPHCGFTCESTIGYEDIIEEEYKNGKLSPRS